MGKIGGCKGRERLGSDATALKASRGREVWGSGGWVGEGDGVSEVARLLSKRGNLIRRGQASLCVDQIFTATSCGDVGVFKNQILNEFPPGQIQTRGNCCLILEAGVSRGSVLIEQTGDGAGCLGAMLEVRLAEPGSSIIRRKHIGSSWASRT